jgi:DUF1365 family protein
MTPITTSKRSSACSPANVVNSDDSALLACAVKYPLLTLRVIFLIHWHAFLLWLKKLPVCRKAAEPHLQAIVTVRTIPSPRTKP